MISTYELARKRIVRKKRFYQHLTIFLGIMLLFFFLNLLTFFSIGWHYTPGSNYTDVIKAMLKYPYWWFPYPLVAWGSMLFIHYCTVFGIPFIGQFDEKWQAEAIAAEVKRIESQANTLNSIKKTNNSLDLKTLQKEVQTKDQWTDSELI